MRKLMMKMSISVDGFVSGPNGEFDWVFKSSTEDSRAPMDLKLVDVKSFPGGIVARTYSI